MLDSLTEKEILPKSTEDETLPTQIAKLDTHLAFLKQQQDRLTEEIASTSMDRDLLIKRAKDVHVSEDSEYRIVEVPVFAKKTVDVEALKRLAPDKHAMIVSNLTVKAQDKIKAQLDKISVYIAQADVKAVISDKGLLAQIIPEQTKPTAWETSVVKKK